MKCRALIFIFISVLFCNHLFACYYEQEFNLRGRWLFTIGDDPSYAIKDYDDSDWVKIRVPENWEDEGFPGYDGYAWYRIHFVLPEEINTKALYLHLGKVDDVDEAYLNGRQIGKTGEFEPNYQTSWIDQRIYALPKSILKFGEENVIAVKVYDEEGPGGIYSGKIGIYSKYLPKMVVEFTPEWKFSPGDNPDWSKVNWDDRQWDGIITQKEYLSYRRGQRSSHRKLKDILELIFEAIFD